MTGVSSDTTSRMMRDLNSLCDFGGRLSGTPSEAAARDWLRQAGAEAMGVPAIPHEVPYEGWRATRVSLEIEGVGLVDAHPLLRSAATPPEGIEAEVVDLGRGIEADFVRVGDDLRGRIAMVRHEVMFSEGTFHRRKKLQLAQAAGAVGVLIVSRTPGGPVTGSARVEQETPPALGISPETAELLTDKGGKRRRAKFIIQTEEKPAVATNLIFDRAGPSGKWVVLSAHYDGHDLAESALDNASGVAACLEVARRLSKEPTPHGLRLAFFTVEEWGLQGSHRYLEEMDQSDREDILLDANADTVAGGSRLTAMTSGFPGLTAWMNNWANASGTDINIFEPFQANSDNASFARFGIPAFRLVSGFNEPDAPVRHVLTPGDTRDLIAPEDMTRAANLLEQITREALKSSVGDAMGWRAKNAD